MTMVFKEKTLSSLDFASNFVDGLCELWRYGKCCDSEIEVGNRVFKFHRIVLAVASPSFFDTKCSPVSDRLVIQLPVDTDTHVLDDVLHYLYGNDITITSKCVDTVLKLSSLFKIKTLTEFCEQFKQENENSGTRRSSISSRTGTKCSNSDTTDSPVIDKKTLNFGFKFPAPVIGLRRSRGGRGSRGITSGKARGSVTLCRGRGTNRVKTRGVSRGRGRLYKSARATSTVVKHEQDTEYTNVNSDNHQQDYSDVESYSQSTYSQPASGDESAGIDSETESADSTSSPPKIPRAKRGRKRGSLMTEIRNSGKRKRSTVSDSESIKDENEHPGVLGLSTSSLFRGTSRGRKRGRGRGRGLSRGRGRGVSQVVPGLPRPTLTSAQTGTTATGIQSLSPKEFHIRQRNVAKQRKYREKMRASPEWRKKEAERVRMRYVPISQLPLTEQMLKRQRDNERCRKWRLKKKLKQLQLPYDKIGDLQTIANYSDDLMIPNNSNLYLDNDNSSLLNTLQTSDGGNNINPGLTIEGGNGEVTIKVEEGLNEEVNSYIAGNLTNQNTVDNTVDNSNMEITYHLAENGEQVQLTDNGEQITRVSNPGENFTGVSNLGENFTGVSNPGENFTGVSNPGENFTGVSNPGENFTGVSNPGENFTGVSNPGENFTGVSTNPSISTESVNRFSIQTILKECGIHLSDVSSDHEEILNDNSVVSSENISHIPNKVISPSVSSETVSHIPTENKTGPDGPIASEHVSNHNEPGMPVTEFGDTGSCFDTVDNEMSLTEPDNQIGDKNIFLEIHIQDAADNASVQQTDHNC